MKEEEVHSQMTYKREKTKGCNQDQVLDQNLHLQRTREERVERGMEKMNAQIKTEPIDESETSLQVVAANAIIKIEALSETSQLLLSAPVYKHVIRVFSEGDGLPKRLEIQSKLKEDPGRKGMDITLTRTLRSSAKARPAAAPNKSIGVEEHFSAKAIKIEPHDLKSADKICSKSKRRPGKTRPSTAEKAIETVSKNQLTNETPEHRERRLAACNVAMKLRIRDETPKERKKRLEACNSGMRRRIANESAEEREKRLAAANLAMRRKIANETPEEREKRLAASWRSMERRLANETFEEREKRLAASRRSMERRLANETFEEREKRLTAANLAMRRRIANETPEEREERLAAARKAANGKKRSRRYS